jgi:hypothetical protein
VNCAVNEARALSILLAGDEDFTQIVQKLDDLKNYANSIGCQTIEFYGREGGVNLKPFGLDKTQIVMRLKL